MRVFGVLFVCAVDSRLQYPGPYPPGGSCNSNGPETNTICIAAPFGSNAVLQRAPAHAAITGSVPAGYGKAMIVTVTIVQEDGDFHHKTSAAIRLDNTWKVLLPPRPTFGNYSLNATCTSGCEGENATITASLRNLTFGDVYVCAGQSNSTSLKFSCVE